MHSSYGKYNRNIVWFIIMHFKNLEMPQVYATFFSTHFDQQKIECRWATKNWKLYFIKHFTILLNKQTVNPSFYIEILKP